jgi:DNA-directed RNA polymerase subunit M/transcription elongation factor TFIIS
MISNVLSPHTTQITRKIKLIRKAVDDILDGDDADKNLAQTDGENVGSNNMFNCLQPFTNATQHGSPARLPLPFLLAARCPECAHDKAYFHEMQTRSADEPATLFFKCVNCKFKWREG